jgi:hypothetical protein
MKRKYGLYSPGSETTEGLGKTNIISDLFILQCRQWLDSTEYPRRKGQYSGRS